METFVEVELVKGQVTQLETKIEKMEKSMDELKELVTEIKLLTQEMKATKETVGDIKKNVDELKARPAKRWDEVVGTVIKCIIGALVGYAFAKVGLG